MAPARTRLARKQNAGLLVGSPSFADTAGRSRSQPKMEDNLFTSPYDSVGTNDVVMFGDAIRQATVGKGQH